MKRMRKLLAVVLAITVALTMGIATTSLAFADETTGTITINPPTNADASKTNTYQIYKVFDAVGNGTDISYKLCEGDTLSDAMKKAGFSVDAKGNVSGPANLNDEAIAAIAAYVTDGDLVDTATSTGTTEAVSKALPNGYYYIKTNTGSAVTIDSTNPTATVNDKNTIPTVDKTITGASSITENGKKALAQIGTDVTFTAVVNVGKGSKNLVFHDTMDAGLAFKSDSVAVTGVDADKYTVKQTPDTGDTLTITFADGIAAGTEITITYAATITAAAVTELKNDAYLNYGDNNSTTHSTTETYNAEISVQKYDGKIAENKALKGAGFKLKNSEGKFYKQDNGVVTWVAEEQGEEHVSGEDGKVAAFAGLANGTYTLVETTVPNGYNTAADTEITVSEGNYTAANLQQVAKVENNKGGLLPSTGGIGTTIFYILGALLLIGCGIVLVARRRMAAK